MGRTSIIPYQRAVAAAVSLAACVAALAPSQAVAHAAHTGVQGTPNARSAAAAKQPSAKKPPVKKPGTTKSPSSVGAVGAPAGASVQVVQTPVGLSFEYPLMEQYLGSGPCPPTALVAELQELGSPPISLAGNSQDLTAPSGALTEPFPNWDTATLYQLPPAFWSQLHCLLATTRDPLTVGLNAKLGQLSWAQLMVAGAQSAATNGLSFSLGNEPDLYYLPNYSSLGKRAYNEEVAVNNYLQVAAYLRPALGALPVQGPELAIASNWQHQLPRVIATVGAKTVGVHLYPLSACGSPKAVTIPRLLSVTAADAPDTLGWVVSDANTAGVPAILSESNSAACGGAEGVSNTQASAVWAIRFVLSAIKTGFQQVRFHASGGPYDPFVVVGSEVQVRPLAGAMATIEHWLPVGASLQTLRSPSGTVATAVSVAGAPTEVICDNETTNPRTIDLPATAELHGELVGPVQQGIRNFVLHPRRGRATLTLPANSIAAVTP